MASRTSNPISACFMYDSTVRLAPILISRCRSASGSMLQCEPNPGRRVLAKASRWARRHDRERARARWWCNSSCARTRSPIERANRGPAASTKRDVRLFHDAAPQLHLILEVARELFRRVLARDDVELLEPVGDLRRRDRLVERRVELRDDLLCRAVRHERAVPFVGLEARQRFGYRRHVGQAREPALAGMRDRLELAALDQPDRRRSVGEE